MPSSSFSPSSKSSSSSKPVISTTFTTISLFLFSLVFQKFTDSWINMLLVFSLIFLKLLTLLISRFFFQNSTTTASEVSLSNGSLTTCMTDIIVHLSRTTTWTVPSINTLCLEVLPLDVTFLLYTKDLLCSSSLLNFNLFADNAAVYNLLHR